MTRDHIVLHGKQVSRQAMVEFKAAYLAAVDRGDAVFTAAVVGDQKVLVAYAKYLLEYAETQMGPL